MAIPDHRFMDLPTSRRPAGIRQSAVSKMERRADMYVSTLQSMIRAMGGTLQILAVFPEGKVEIDQFRKLRRTNEGE